MPAYGVATDDTAVEGGNRRERKAARLTVDGAELDRLRPSCDQRVAARQHSVQRIGSALGRGAIQGIDRSRIETGRAHRAGAVAEDEVAFQEANGTWRADVRIWICRDRACCRHERTV